MYIFAYLRGIVMVHLKRGSQVCFICTQVQCPPGVYILCMTILDIFSKNMYHRRHSVKVDSIVWSWDLEISAFLHGSNNINKCTGFNDSSLSVLCFVIANGEVHNGHLLYLSEWNNLTHVKAKWRGL